MTVTLTPRQLACLRLAALGLRNAQIAAALGIHDQTVKNHLTGAYLRLGVTCRTGAVVALWRMEAAQ